MSKKKRKKVPAEFAAGRRAYWEQIGPLRKEWPKAFPEDPKRVRPLEMNALGMIAEKMGWSVLYTRGVLQPWKTRAAYCKAVLRYEKRISLDGKQSAELVGEDARNQAQKALDQIKQKSDVRPQPVSPLVSAEPSVSHQT